MKNSKLWGSESFQVGEHTHMLGGWCIPTTQEQKLLCSGPLWTQPMYPFIWLFLCILCHIHYNKLVNISVSLSSVSHYSKLLNLRRKL